ncbi:hypothetical protein PQU92_07505 [Asticcacaulis sp. BYS171W]|uniref:Histidine kinase/HSP90-like ATPase domain-containing protein n=1 Tax=Asticcacaulis aquaticus TaxID=2984212 RepID=A0ABT5HSS1_9CAUL|nr:ATP-binding protein [Asticcacaulis aquaticus]MDC7683118.1 hypothetical protein [Asticcacaulis aquaticus]
MSDTRLPSKAALDRLLGNAALWGVAVATVALVVLTLWAALNLPQFSGRFVARDDAVYLITDDGEGRVTGLSNLKVLLFTPEAADFVPEPDTLPGYADYDRFLSRQAVLNRMAQGDFIRVWIDGGPVQDLRPQPRTMADLPPAFWSPVITGLIVFFIGGWVWAMRPRDLVTRLLFLNAFGLMVSALSMAVYGARPLAVEPHLFLSLMVLNHAGAALFGTSILALLMLYPRRLTSGNWALAMLFSVVPIVVADQMRLLGSPGGTYLVNGIHTLGILGLIAAQAVATRRDPRGRAALVWLGVSVALGTVAWMTVVTLYALSGDLTAMPEAYAFLSFLVIYLGLAFAVSRFRLFEAGDWAFRILFFALAAVLFIALDAALVYVAHLGQSPAMTLSMLLIAFGYLPLRDGLWRRIVRGKALDGEARFAAALDIVHAPATERADRWANLLHGLFEPLRIDAVAGAVPVAAIEAEGMALCVPSFEPGQSLRLNEPRLGRSLFTPAQEHQVRQLWALIDSGVAGLEAYERGAKAERRKVAQDLHDDVGARLLSGLMVADDRTRPILQSALADIRTLSSAMLAEAAPLGHVLADVRAEAAGRLEAAGIALDWELAQDTDAVIDHAQQKALVSGVREIVSNIIRHSGAAQVIAGTRMDDGLTLTIADDGRGLDAGLTEGSGLPGLRARFAAAGGRADISSETGVSVTLHLPVTERPLSGMDAYG